MAQINFGLLNTNAPYELGTSIDRGMQAELLRRQAIEKFEADKQQRAIQNKYNQRQQELLQMHYQNDAEKINQQARENELKRKQEASEMKFYLPKVLRAVGYEVPSSGIGIDETTGEFIGNDGLPIADNSIKVSSTAPVDEQDELRELIQYGMNDPKLRTQAFKAAVDAFKNKNKATAEFTGKLGQAMQLAKMTPEQKAAVKEYNEIMKSTGQTFNIIMPDSKPVTPDQTEKLVKRGLLGDQLGRLKNNFKDEYAGYKLDVVGDVSNWMKARFGNDSAQVNWWKDYKDYENNVRHELFGAALTGYEIDLWQQANVSPGMKPDVVRENLRRRHEIEKTWMDRTNEALGASGYVRESVGTATGRNDAKTPSKVNVPKPAGKAKFLGFE